MRNEEEILGDNSTKHFPCVSSVTHPPLRSRLSGRPSALRERGQPRMRTVNSSGQVILTGGGGGVCIWTHSSGTYKFGYFHPP